MSIKSNISSYIKNISGWKSHRKLLAFAVDDYGNIRLSSREAREKLKTKNVTLSGRFNNFDALDTREDFEQLFDVLNSVKDKNGKPAVFTTYAMPANINFLETLKQGKFVPENLNTTYEKLAAEGKTTYYGAFELLHKGITSGLIRPQFHGREHLNINVLNHLLKGKNEQLIANMEVNSLAGIPQYEKLPGVRFSEAFSLCYQKEVDNHKKIIKDGLERFKKVYGYWSTTFTPPAMLLHPSLYSYVESLGIKAIDKPRSHQVHLGDGDYKSEKNKLGLQKGQNHVTIVRNCMFEPNSKEMDWVNFTFNQIKAAFFFKKPAIISSHRVNFAGHIEPENRRKGLNALKLLLKKVVKAYPDVEFLGIDDLVDEMLKEN